MLKPILRLITIIVCIGFMPLYFVYTIIYNNKRLTYIPSYICNLISMHNSS